MSKSVCERSTWINLETFIVFDLHKQLANNASLFSIVQDITPSTASLNHNVPKILNG